MAIPASARDISTSVEAQIEGQQVIIQDKQHEKQEENDNHNDHQEISADSDDKASNLEDYPEYISVDLGQILSYLTCQICLGIMRKVRAVKACSHRFCGECIEKSLRVGKKECPLCRVYCANRRATVDDAHFDGIVTHLLPYIDQEDYMLSEEDKSRNEQLQASISEIAADQQSKRRRTNRRDP